MARKPTGKPVGCPQKEIDWEEFEKLCELQCTQSEIAGFLKVHPETLSNRVVKKYGEDYSSVYKKHAESGKCSLRRHQFVLSKKNSSMAIWLGKQWLGQKDISKEVTEDIAQELINAVRDSEAKLGWQNAASRVGKAEQPPLAIEQSVLHQGCAGESNQVRNELGAERTL